MDKKKLNKISNQQQIVIDGMRFFTIQTTPVFSFVTNNNKDNSILMFTVILFV